MSKEKLYLTGGGNETKLPSGQKGLYIDIDLDSLNNLLKERPEIKRDWTTRDGEDRTSLRIFITPSKRDGGYYSHYLEAAYPKEKIKEPEMV